MLESTHSFFPLCFAIHYLNHFNRPYFSFLHPCPHYLPSHSGFLPQTLNVSLRESLVLSLCHSLYFPFLPPPSIIMALTLEGHLKCHIPVREPAWWCMVGHLFPFQSPNWLRLTVRRGREDMSGQSNICLLRWLIGTVSNLSAVSLHRARAYNRFRRELSFFYRVSK